MNANETLKSEIAQKMTLDQVRYSQVWEDHLLLERGLDINPDDDVLSICSAGDNVLALLLLEPRSVTAIDMNPAQTALLELKIAAIRVLDHQDFARLLGVRPGTDRLQIFERIQNELSAQTREFWLKRSEDIDQGLIDKGRLERYIQTFAQDHLPTLWTPDVLSGIFEQRPLEEQREFVGKQIGLPEFEQCFRWYFGREKMAEQGRDPAQFEHVEEGDVGGYFYKRFCGACTELALHTNFYIEYFLTGQYRNLETAPPYLRPQNYDRLKNLVERVHIHTGELEQVLDSKPSGYFSKANLSDIFEYMSPELNEAVFEALGRQLRPGGRIAYWNLLVPRTSSHRLRHLLQPLTELSEQLHAQDRSWFYRAFHVEQLCT